MTTAQLLSEQRSFDVVSPGDHSTWYKDAVIYELHVRAFHDGNGDGVGDFKGLVEKLDYLQGLGVTALWLLPFYPSPLRDDGYDISDYRQVHPSYGTLRDFRLFLREAHRRGMRVITELVLAHTSDQHPWFQRARHARPGSSHRDFYVWSDTPDRFADARVIFKDFESSNWSFDPVAGAYFWHRFYSHQPSLNYDSALVRQSMFDVVDFWLSMGVDGLRLDAVPYLYAREGTTSENLPETFDFLRQLRAHVDARFQDRMLLAEANQWPEDAVEYMGRGDMCHMAFHFPLMPRMFMAARQEDRFPIVDILAEIPSKPPDCQWALFLRNHDELTLEMVTDEERDYMYRAYAQDPQARVNVGIRRRLAPLLGNDRKLIEMMNGLLFSMPGTPIIYYGDEIGMGDNIYLGDRNSVRTPMQWNSDRNAGFSDANPQRLYLPVVIDPEYHSQAINVEAQNQNPNSLLWWMKRLIALRQRYKAFGRGTLEILLPENRKVFAFIRHFEDERILCVFNLSRHVQCAELDLSSLRGAVPVELSGNQEFPPIGELPYFITLGPHGFYWFSLEYEPDELQRERPVFSTLGRWDTIFEAPSRRRFETWLPTYLLERRWFGQKSRTITSATIVDTVPIPASASGTSRPEADRSAPAAHLVIVQLELEFGAPERYVLPLAYVEGSEAEEMRKWHADAVVADLRTRLGRGGTRRRRALERLRHSDGGCVGPAADPLGPPRSDGRRPLPQPAPVQRLPALGLPDDADLGRAVQFLRPARRRGHHEVPATLRGGHQPWRRARSLSERAGTVPTRAPSGRKHRVSRARRWGGAGHPGCARGVRTERRRWLALCRRRPGARARRCTRHLVRRRPPHAPTTRRRDGRPLGAGAGPSSRRAAHGVGIPPRETDGGDARRLGCGAGAGLRSRTAHRVGPAGPVPRCPELDPAGAAGRRFQGPDLSLRAAGAGARGGDHRSAAKAERCTCRGVPDPLSRRLPPGAGAVDREGLLHH